MSTLQDDRFTFQRAEDTASEHIAAPRYSYWKSVFRKFFSSKLAIAMLILAGTIILLSIFQPMISGYSPRITPTAPTGSVRMTREIPCLTLCGQAPAAP